MAIHLLVMHTNWLSNGWVDSHSSLSSSITASGTIEGNDPGFVNITNSDFHLTEGSACIDSADIMPQTLLVEWEFLVPQNGVQCASLNDLGAYNY